jgi:inhibitor of KinA sporulation pathway (predicted exonuclease)
MPGTQNPLLDVLAATTGSLVVFDLEWTSWPGFMQSGWSQPGRHREINSGYAEQAGFELLVRPGINRELSPYITRLTGITQTNMRDEAVDLPVALSRFAAFCDGAGLLCCNGDDDVVISENCRLQAISCPEVLRRPAYNLRPLFVETTGVSDSDLSSCDLSAHFGLTSAGASHTALADAREIAAALRHLDEVGQLHAEDRV